MNDVAINIMTLIAIILFARLGMKMFALYQMYKNDPDDDIDFQDAEDLSNLDDTFKDDDDDNYEDVDLDLK